MRFISLVALTVILAGCAGQPGEPSDSAPVALTDIQASAGEPQTVDPLPPVTVPRSGFTVQGPNHTCLTVAEMPREWGVGVAADHPTALRVRGEAVYSPIAGCGRVTAPPDGDGRLSNLEPIGTDSFPAGVGGVALFKLDTNMACGRVEYHTWIGSQMVGWFMVNAGVNCAPKPPSEPPTAPPPPQPPLIACPANPLDIWAKRPPRHAGTWTDGRYVIDLAGYLKPEYVGLHLVLTSWQKHVPGQLLPQTLTSQTPKAPGRSDMAVAVASCSAQVDLLVCPGAIPQKLDGATFAPIDRAVAFADWNPECQPKPEKPSKDGRK